MFGLLPGGKTFPVAHARFLYLRQSTIGFSAGILFFLEHFRELRANPEKHRRKTGSSLVPGTICSHIWFC